MTTLLQPALVLRKRATAALIGVSIATLDRLRAAGSFVRPIRLGDQAIGFKRSEVEDWIASRPLCNHFAESF